MKTIINKNNKTTVIRAIANDMDSNKFNRTFGMNELYNIYVVEKGGVDVYEIVGVMKTKQTKSGWAFKAKKFGTKSTFAWTIEAGETVTHNYCEAKEIADENKIKKLVTYFK